ncbi:MAG: flagellar motor switch protein FliN [Gammaproteobacteria bacterium]|nr:flagellar motor switch protein FliN [Gammaproteobacteria bacterium]
MADHSENTARRIELADLPSAAPKGRTLLDENHELIKNIKVRLSVSIGRGTLTVKELLNLKEGSVVTLDRGTQEPVDLLLDGKLVARGELIAVGDNFGVRISEVLGG